MSSDVAFDRVGTLFFGALGVVIFTFGFYSYLCSNP